MNLRRTLPVVLVFLLLATLACGCTTTEEPAQPTPEATIVPTPEDTPAVAVTEPVIITSPGVPDYKTSIRATPISNNMGVTVTIDIDATGLGSNMASEGDNLFMVAFAYNDAAVPEDFTVTSYTDVITSGIPYKSKTDRVFPMNIRSYPLAVIGQKDGMQVNPGEPYAYGAVIMLRDEV
jgi:hypothetical protein